MTGNAAAAQSRVCQDHEPDMGRWVICHEGGDWDAVEVPRTANPCGRCGVLVVYDNQPSRAAQQEARAAVRSPSTADDTA